MDVSSTALRGANGYGDDPRILTERCGGPGSVPPPKLRPERYRRPFEQ
jgi:hypothetical protein